MGLKSIQARQIFDSRGNPTVEVDLLTDKGKNKIRVEFSLEGFWKSLLGNLILK